MPTSTGIRTDLNRNRFLIGIVATVLAAATLGAFAQRRALRMAWWTWQAESPLTADEQMAIAACTAPGWTGLSRMLLQDLPHTCDGGWLANQLASVGNKPHRRWIGDFVTAPSSSPRQRATAGLSLMLAGEPEVPALSLMLDHPAVRDEFNEWLLVSVEAGDLPADWLDPRTTDQLRLRSFVAGDDDPQAWAARRLRQSAYWPVDASTLEPLVGEAMARADWDDGMVQQWRDRMASGYGVANVPTARLDSVADAGVSCAVASEPACLRLIAGLLDVQDPDLVFEGEASPPLPAPTMSIGPAALWEVLNDGDERASVEGSQLLLEVADWVAAAPADHQAARLLGAVASQHSDYSPQLADAGHVGDPVWAVRHRAASPWASALAVVVIADHLDIEVAVGEWSQGVAIRVGDRVAGLAEGGLVLSMPFATAEEPNPPQPPVRPLSRQQVEARAAIEAYAAARAAGQVDRSRAIARYVERLDAERGAALVAEVGDTAFEDADGRAGVAAGNLFR